MTTPEEFFSDPNIYIPFNSTPHGEEDETLPKHSNEVDKSSYYALLGLPTSASFSDIRQAYLDLSRRYHTDRHLDVSDEAKELMRQRFLELNAAYSVLSDVRERAVYDAKGLKGAKMLSLIPISPSSSASPRDIIDLVCSLDRANRIKEMAKMLSAKSTITLRYSWVEMWDNVDTDLLRQPLLHSSVAGPVNDDVEELASEKQNQTELPVNEEEISPPVEKMEGGKNEEIASAASEEPSSLNSVSAHPVNNVPVLHLSNASCQLVQVKMKNSDEPTYILVPSKTLVKEIQSKVDASSGTGSLTVGAEEEEDGDDNKQFALRIARALLTFLFPKMIYFEHSFQHVINPRSSLVFSGKASSSIADPSENDLSVGVMYNHSISKVKSWVIEWGTSLRKLFLAVEWKNQFRGWSLMQRLVVMNGLKFLDSFRLIVLTTVKEKFSVLHILDLSLFRLPIFVLFLGSPKSSMEILVGPNILDVCLKVLNISILPSFPPAPGVSRNNPHEAKPAPEDGASSPKDNNDSTSSTPFSSIPPCSLSLCTKISPLAGKTKLSWKVLYSPSPMYRVGLGFYSWIPFSVSPFAPPYFAVKPIDNTPQISCMELLYERGGHQIEIPIAVFASTTVWKNFMWVSAPLVLVRLGCLLYIPYIKERRAKFYLKERAKHLPEVDMARQKALLEQQVLRPSVLESRAEEENKGGLIILLATYGVLYPEYTARQRRFYGDDGDDAVRMEYSPASAPGSPTINSFIEQPPILTRGMTRITKWIYRFTFSSKWGGFRWLRQKKKKLWGRKKTSKSHEDDIVPTGGLDALFMDTGSASNSSGHSKPSSSNMNSHTTGKREFPTGNDAMHTALDHCREPLTSPCFNSVGQQTAPPPLPMVNTTTEKEILATTVPLSLDVTVALQLLVRNSALTLPAGTKAHLTGFYDPDPYTAERKMLKIIYLYRNQRHVVVFSDEDEGILPQRSHQVNDSSSSDDE